MRQDNAADHETQNPKTENRDRGGSSTRIPAAMALCLCLVLACGCGARRSAQYTEQGDTYLRLRKPADAAEAYQRAIKADPKNAAAMLGLARSQRLRKQPEQALATYRQAAAVDPTLEQAYVEVVQVLLALATANPAGGFEDQTEEFVKKCEEANPEHGGLLRAYVLRQTGKTDDAVTLLGGLRERLPQSVGVRVALASAYLAKKEPDKAEQELKSVLDQLDANSVPARMALIDVYQSQGRLPEIVDQLQRLVEQHPDDAGLKLALARSLLDSGRVAEAEAMARPVLEKNPDSGWANYIVGCCLLKQDKFAEAADCLETAAQSLPQEPAVAAGLALARSGGVAPAGPAASLPPRPAEPSATVPGAGPPSEPPAALAEGKTGPPPETSEQDWRFLWRSAQLEQLVAERQRFLAQDDANSRDTIALAALFTGARDVADEVAGALPEDAPLRAYLAALKDGKPDAITKLLAEWNETADDRRILRQNAEGFAYALIGARAQALRSYADCVKNWPGNGVALYNLARMYRALQMPQFAAGCLQKLIAVHRNNMEARDLLFRVTIEAGQKPEAQQVAEATYSLFPNNRTALLDLAQVYGITGQPALAVAVLERGIAALPDDPGLRIGLADARLRNGDARGALDTLEGLTAPPAFERPAAAIAAFAAAGLADWAVALERCQAVAPAATDQVPRSPLSLRLLHAAALVQADRASEAAAAIQGNDAGAPTADDPATDVLLRALGKDSPAPNAAADDVSLAASLAKDQKVLANYAYGLACRAMGLHTVAVDAFQQVTDAVGGSPRLLALLLQSLSQVGANAPGGDERVKRAKDLAAKYPAAPVAWLGLAQVLAATGDAATLAAEREALDKALDVGPDDVDVWQQRARFFERQQDMASVLTAYQRLAGFLPDDPKVANNLAYALLATGGDAAEALKWAQQAAAKLKTNPQVLHTLGLAQLRTGDVEESLKSLGIALQLRPSDPTALLDYGQALIQSGKPDEGKGQIKLALFYTDQLGLDFPRRAEADKIVGAPPPPDKPKP